MPFDDLRALCSARKWFDCAQELKSLAENTKTAKKKLPELVEIFTSILPHMHPASSAETAVAFVPRLALDDAIGLLEQAADAIVAQRMLPDSFLNELTSVQMHLCLCRIRQGELDDRESEILKWRKMHSRPGADGGPVSIPFSRANHELLQYVTYCFYSAIGNVEEAQRHLLAYVTASGDNSELEQLVKLSLVSKIFFDFSSVIALEGFKRLSSKRLISLFEDFQRGHFAQIEKRKKEIVGIINEILGTEQHEEYMNYVAEKVYLINIMNMCFQSEHKCVMISRMLADLQIEENYLIALLLKALGIGLISGWIDSERGILFFDRVIPRSLGNEDIAKMKQKLVVWRNRVVRAIEKVESN